MCASPPSHPHLCPADSLPPGAPSSPFPLVPPVPPPTRQGVGKALEVAELQELLLVLLAAWQLRPHIQEEQQAAALAVLTDDMAGF